MIKIDLKKGIVKMEGHGDEIYNDLTYALHSFYEHFDDKKIGDEVLENMVNQAKMSTSDIIDECLNSDDEMIRNAAKLLKDLREFRKKFEDIISSPSDKTDIDDSFSSLFSDLLDNDKES